MKSSFEFAETVDKDKLTEVRATPIEDILKQHNKRFVIHTKERGDIVLKFLPRRVKEVIDALRILRYPEYPKLEEELEIIRLPILSGEAGKETTDKFWELFLQLRPSLDLYFLGCIEFPFITTMEELDKLMGSLQEDEKNVMHDALRLLSAPVQEIDDTYLAIAMKFGIQVIDKELIDNMTYQQYTILYSVIDAERQQAAKMYRRLEAIHGS